jgi:hypothetical protein
MLSRSEPQQIFSDYSIREFFLGRLPEKDQSAFERALFLDSELERRTRLEEIALADDYANGKLRGKDLTMFIERFPFSDARQNQIEVSRALSDCFARQADVQRANRWLTLEHPLWKLAFATMILIMLFATIWLATKQPRIVRRLIPHRSRPAATTPTPEVAHHAERASERPAHREDAPAPPSHEDATNTIVLDSMTTEESAPTVTVATVHEQNLRVQLLVSENTPSTYLAELMDSRGEVVYSDANIAQPVEAGRVKFDIPIEQLAAGDFRIKLTRSSDGKQATYFLRVR